MFLKFKLLSGEYELVELIEDESACVVALYYIITSRGFSYVDVLWSDGSIDTRTAYGTPIFPFGGAHVVQSQFLPLPAIRNDDTIILVPDRVDLQQQTPSVQGTRDYPNYQTPRGIRINPGDAITAPTPQTGTCNEFWDPWC